MTAPYYQDEHCTIYHGDCREILPTLGPVDCVIADPPYSINTKSDGTGKLSPWADLCNASLWYELWMGLCRGKVGIAGCLWSFLSWRTLPTFQKASCAIAWPIESLLIWDKAWISTGGQKGLRPSYEMVALFCGEHFTITNRGIPDIKQVAWSSTKPTGHPAEKPRDLMQWLIDISEANLILDPFMGSGTTLRAAKDLGRKAIGIEIEERWCEIAAQRLRQEVLPLRDEAPLFHAREGA